MSFKLQEWLLNKFYPRNSLIPLVEVVPTFWLSCWNCSQSSSSSDTSASSSSSSSSSLFLLEEAVGFLVSSSEMSTSLSASSLRPVSSTSELSSSSATGDLRRCALPPTEPLGMGDSASVEWRNHLCYEIGNREKAMGIVGIVFLYLFISPNAQ